VLRISLHGVDQIRDQIRAALELHRDLALRGVRLLVERLYRVIPAPRQEQQQGKS
jgi:hypothetical protein